MLIILFLTHQPISPRPFISNYSRLNTYIQLFFSFFENLFIDSNSSYFFPFLFIYLFFNNFLILQFYNLLKTHIDIYLKIKY